jgi:acylglycerol lipase
VIVHGASEHGGRYNFVVDVLVPRGYAVYAMDHRGHGRSEGKRSQLDRMDHVISDLDAFVDLVSSEEPQGKPFLVGHSMGGCIGLEYTLRHQEKLRSLVLSAPAVVPETASPIVRGAAKALSAVAPNLGVYEVDANGVSRDLQVVHDYVNDPLVYNGKLPARTIAELAKSFDTFPERIPQLKLPLLVMYGTADPIVKTEGSHLVYDLASSEDKTLTPWEGLYHEIFNEPERDDVIGALADWLDAH